MEWAQEEERHRRTTEQKHAAEDSAASAGASTGGPPPVGGGEMVQALQVRWPRHRCHEMITSSLPWNGRVIAAMIRSRYH